MRIGVLSDTHIYLPEDLNTAIVRAFSNVDLIVHAGDFIGSAVLDRLMEIGEVKAVRGNMDSAKLREMLPEKELLEVGDRKIGIIHGSGGPWGIEGRVRSQFGKIDIIIYGHSHEARKRETGGVYFFNPGPGKRSFGILTVEEDIHGEIIKL